MQARSLESRNVVNLGAEDDAHTRLDAIPHGLCISRHVDHEL